MSESGYSRGWRTDRYKRFLPELDSCKALKSNSNIKTSPMAESTGYRLELMMHTASVNRTLVEAFIEDVAVRGDGIGEGDLTNAKLEDYVRERDKQVNLAHLREKLTMKDPPPPPPPVEASKNKFVLLNDMPVEKYGKQTRMNKKQLSEKNLKLSSPSPTPVFFTESPDKPGIVKEKEVNKKDRWEPLSYMALEELGFNFRVAPGEGQLWGKTTKVWKPDN